MSFLEQVRTNHPIQTPKNGSWRARYHRQETWATSNPWDEAEVPTEAEIKLCIRELFEAVNDGIACLRFIQEKTGDTNAKALADILEGQ